jgi:hypothetical protein
MQAGLASLFIAELAANVAAKIPAFGLSREELIIPIWGELEITVDFAAMESQIELPLALIVRS